MGRPRCRVLLHLRRPVQLVTPLAPLSQMRHCTLLSIVHLLKAVCARCSNFFLNLPDLGYNNHVRVCKTCAQVEIMKRKQSHNSTFSARSAGDVSNRASQGGVLRTNEKIDMEFMEPPRFNSFHSVSHHEDLTEGHTSKSKTLMPYPA